MKAEQKASLTVDEVKHLKDIIFSTQESMLQAEQKAEEVKSSYERKIKDLEHQALIVESLSKEAWLELEIQEIGRAHV